MTGQEAVRVITTPPNWSMEGQNEALNKTYRELVDKHFSKYQPEFISEYTDIAMFHFSDTDEAINSTASMFSEHNKVGINLYKNHDNVILEIHGAETLTGESLGKVPYGGYDFKVSEIIQRLEDTGLIPPDTKQIYTLSCYGGLQEKGTTASGIAFESMHTSDKAVHTPKANSEFRYRIQESLSSLEGNRDKILKLMEDHSDDPDFLAKCQDVLNKYEEQIVNFKEQLSTAKNQRNILQGYTENGQFTDKFKKDTLRLYEEYGDEFADIQRLATSEELQQSLWYLKSEKENRILHEQAKYIQQEIDSNSDILKEIEEIKDLKVTSQSQKELKEQILQKSENLKTISNKLRQDLSEIDEKIVQVKKFDEQYGKDFKVRTYESKIEPKIEPKVETPKIKTETPKSKVKEVKISNLKPKTINNTAKKALDTKGIGLAIAAGVVAVGTVGAVIHHDNKKKKEKEAQRRYEQQHSNEINYDNDLAYANSISKFSKGHYAYSL